MKHIGIAAILLILSGLLYVGCAGGARLDGSSEEGYRASFERALKSLDDEGQEAFKDALAALVFDKDGETAVSVLAGKRRGVNITDEKESELIRELMNKTGGMTPGDVIGRANSMPQLKTTDLRTFNESLEEVSDALESDDLREFESAFDLIVLDNGGDDVRALLAKNVADDDQLSSEEKRIKRMFLRKFENRTARDVVVMAQELPRIDGSSRDAFARSMSRVRNSLGTDLKKEFSDAVNRIAFAGKELPSAAAPAPGGDNQQAQQEEPSTDETSTDESGGETAGTTPDADALWDAVMRLLDGKTGGEVIEMAKGL